MLQFRRYLCGQGQALVNLFWDANVHSICAPQTFLEPLLLPLPPPPTPPPDADVDNPTTTITSTTTYYMYNCFCYYYYNHLLLLLLLYRDSFNFFKIQYIHEGCPTKS